MYQTVASGRAPAAGGEVDNRAMLGVVGFFAGGVLSFGIGLFWSIGAIGLLGGNDAGLILELGLEGAWRWLFLSYPFVLGACVVLGIGAFAIGRHLEAAAIAMLPVVATLLYYFALVLFR